jgi:hypothetical protein
VLLGLLQFKLPSFPLTPVVLHTNQQRLWHSYFVSAKGKMLLPNKQLRETIIYASFMPTAAQIRTDR